MTLEFAGAASPLTDADIAAAANEIGVDAALIPAVAEVESAGAGFLPDRRPKILFEAHVFGQRTGHRWDRAYPNISAPSWDRSLYGAAGAHQYDRLAEAIALDRKAALQSASWGRFQIMGFNAERCGFADVESFVAAMRESEAAHLEAFIAFCRANDLLRYLVVHDWRAFARGYNGPGQVEHYSGLLAAAYARHAALAPAAGTGASSPFDTIKRVQAALGVTADGAFGPRSRRALNDALTAAHQPGI